ncbi:MAG: ABC transporter substrate-binding protein, partial [Anaerolineae bacterium]|nr:ABC transporter substrate-binding protein [Anaerolineae bacterium]
AQALVAGLEATGGDPSPEAMIPALEGLEFEGPRGAYTIREADHQVLMDQYVIRFMGVEDVQLRDDLTMTLPIYELFAEIPAADINLPCQLEGDYAARCG